MAGIPVLSFRQTHTNTHSECVHAQTHTIRGLHSARSHSRIWTCVSVCFFVWAGLTALCVLVYCTQETVRLYKALNAAQGLSCLLPAVRWHYNEGRESCSFSTFLVRFLKTTSLTRLQLRKGKDRTTNPQTHLVYSARCGNKYRQCCLFYQRTKILPKQLTKLALHVP